MLAGQYDGVNTPRQRLDFPGEFLEEITPERIPLLVCVESINPEKIIKPVIAYTIGWNGPIIGFSGTLNKVKTCFFELLSILIQVFLYRGSTRFLGTDMNNSFQVVFPQELKFEFLKFVLPGYLPLLPPETSR